MLLLAKLTILVLHINYNISSDLLVLSFFRLMLSLSLHVFSVISIFVVIVSVAVSFCVSNQIPNFASARIIITLARLSDAISEDHAW